MNPISKILHQSITIPFYRQIGGALLFLFFILFGAQQNLQSSLEFHYFLVIEIIENPLGLLIVTLLFATYTVKCGLFISGCLQKKPFYFLRTMNALNGRTKLLHLLGVTVAMLIPVLLYGVIIIFIALKNNSVNAALITTAILISNAWLLATFSNLQLKRGIYEVSNYTFLDPVIFLPRNIAWFLLNFILKKQFKTLLIIKILSFMALYYFVQNDGSVFEERMLWLIFILCIAGHGIIIYKNFQFTETEIRFYRNMPLKRWQILLSFLLVYTVLFLPEWWALRALGFMHQNWLCYFSMILSGPLISLLLHLLLYTDDLNLENYLPLLSGILLLFFFFSFSENKWLVPVIALAGSVIFLYTSFRSFERKSEVQKLE